MADFTRMTAAEADTELREMRQALLAKVAAHERAGQDAHKTQARIHALNRALQALAAEPPAGQQMSLGLPATPPVKGNPARGSYRHH